MVLVGTAVLVGGGGSVGLGSSTSITTGTGVQVAGTTATFSRVATWAVVAVALITSPSAESQAASNGNNKIKRIRNLFGFLNLIWYLFITIIPPS
jgi:uncharacterized membrane protein